MGGYSIMKKTILISLMIFCIVTLLGNNKAFAIQNSEKNTKIVWLYGPIWNTAYDDAYKVYESNSEEKIDVLIKDLETELKGIVKKYKGNKTVPKYVTHFNNDNETWGYVSISKWELTPGMGFGWEYGPQISGYLTTSSLNVPNSAQSNKIPVEYNKMLKAFYVVVMQKELEDDKNELENIRK